MKSMDKIFSEIEEASGLTKEILTRSEQEIKTLIALGRAHFIWKASQEGHSIRQIALALHKDRTSVRHHLRKKFLPPLPNKNKNYLIVENKICAF